MGERTGIRLQEQLHRDLLAQHPEWIDADGNCPTCDSYDRRLAELIASFESATQIHPASSMTNTSSNEIDEALWAAYRRDDKTAVMDYLFRRSLVGIGRSRSFPHLVIKPARKKVALRDARTPDRCG